MSDLEYKIRPMTLDDYDEVYALWMQIHGFGIRSIVIQKKVWNAF